MNQGHRLTTTQLMTMAVASAMMGAIATFAIVKSGIQSAGAETIYRTSNQTEKKKTVPPVVHFEIGCRNVAKTSEFYAKLFDWQIKPDTMSANIAASGKGIAGHITSLGHDPQNYVTVYVEVEDIKATLAKVQEIGGKKIVGPIKIPTGQFAWFSDLDGNLVGLLQPK